LGKKEQNKNTVIFLSPLENQSDPFRENLLINVFPSIGVELDQQVSIDVNRLRQNFTNFQVIDSSANDSVAHNTAYRIVYTYNKDRLDFKVLQFWTMVGDRTYTIKYTAEAAKYSQYLPTIQKMIHSLEIQGRRSFSNGQYGTIRSTWI
jgi:serine/threonine-protein kinase